MSIFEKEGGQSPVSIWVSKACSPRKLYSLDSLKLDCVYVYMLGGSGGVLPQEIFVF